MRRRTFRLLVKVVILTTVVGSVFLLLSSWMSPSQLTSDLSEKLHRNYQKLRGHDKFWDSMKSPDSNELAEAQKIRVESMVKKDWHDYEAIARDLARHGLGDKGQKAHPENIDKDKEKLMFSQNGFNALLSDMISVNRSVPDMRNAACKTKQYLSELPNTSIILIFYNEHWSVLLRSVYSILNRSPPELVKEIILVDDCSDRESLKGKLDDYVAEHLPKVKIVRLAERTGLIGARMAGARAATAEVLIFFDSHIETNYNWLPPLLEPIALNPKASVCPFIDVIDHTDFEYRAQDEGARGAFDWQFYYKRLPLLPEDLEDPTKPFRSPIMAGGLFAIATKFFWELGGYDEGLDIWGGEQYELSFKIWMCGGELLDAPCSRVAHIYRGPMVSKNPRKTDYVHKNYKRVAEVWMDEYAKYIYEHSPGTYERIDAGDLSKQRAIRNKLKCKSFKWFMQEIAFDLPKHYPPVEPPDYAYGTIRSLADHNLCVDMLNAPKHSPIGLYPCSDNPKRPHRNQFWALSWHKDIRIKGEAICLDVPSYDHNAPVLVWECHGQGGNQRWYYDRKKSHIVHGTNAERCLEADVEAKKVYANRCDDDNSRMKWSFGFVNGTALEKFHKDEEDNDDFL